MVDAVAIRPMRLVAAAIAASRVIGSKRKRCGVADVVGERRSVGEEDRIELMRLGALSQFLIIGDVENAVRCRLPCNAMQLRDDRRDR